MTLNLRKLHRKIAPILFIPLLLTALTGLFYRLGRSWFGLPRETAELLLVLHQGEFLGERLVPFYVLLMGLGLLGLGVTGLTMIRRKKQPAKQPQRDWRWVHRILAPIVFLPLAVIALTGIGYSLGEAWFGLSEDRVEILMALHQGSYLGPVFKPLYVLLVGLGLVGLLITGINLSGIFRQRPPQATENE